MTNEMEIGGRKEGPHYAILQPGAKMDVSKILKNKNRWTSYKQLASTPLKKIQLERRSKLQGQPSFIYSLINEGQIQIPSFQDSVTEQLSYYPKLAYSKFVIILLSWLGAAVQGLTDCVGSNSVRKQQTSAFRNFLLQFPVNIDQTGQLLGFHPTVIIPYHNIPSKKKE